MCYQHVCKQSLKTQVVSSPSLFLHVSCSLTLFILLYLCTTVAVACLVGALIISTRNVIGYIFTSEQ